jgi:hypothetical protein
MVNVMKGVGHAPPHPQQHGLILTLMTEHTAECRYYSVYSVEEGSWQEGTPPPPLPPHPNTLSHVVVGRQMAVAMAE